MSRPNRPFTDTIRTAKGEIRGLFESIYEGRALILIGSAKPKKKLPYPPGSVFIKNRDLEKRTNGNTAWMAYTHGLYEAWRVGGHIERNAGGLSDGEIYELLADRDAAHDYVVTILSPEFTDEQVRHKHLIAFHEAASRLGTARDVRKALAYMHMSRAENLTDSAGRRNPGAAAMRVGTGIGLLKDREEEIEFILRHTGLRTFYVFRAIQRSMKVYEAFRWHLNRKRKGKTPNKLRLIILSDAGDKRRALSAVEDLEGGIKTVHAEPFRKNVFHVLDDLGRAREAIRTFGTSSEQAAKAELDTVFRRLYQGIAWPFARDFLEMQIIAPLSWLMSDMDRVRRSGRKKPASRNGISRADAPEKFDAFTARIEDFRGRIELCGDDLLKHPVKSDVLAHTDEALEFVRQDDWEHVKEELETASGLL